MSSLVVGLALPQVSDHAGARAQSRTRAWAGRIAPLLVSLLVIPFVMPVLILSALLVAPLIPLFVWIGALSVSMNAVGFEDSSAPSEHGPLLPVPERA